MSLSRNPELWQSLPAKKKHDLENRLDFVALDEEIKNLKGKAGSANRDRRQKLYIQISRLVAAELCKYQKL
jgi:hypothetical protein